MKILEEFEENLRYKFKKTELLEEALTHKSTKQALNNERLEFLGDAVMDLLVAEYLFKKFSKIAEGDMSKLRAALVNEKSFANMARHLKMGKFLKLSTAEENNSGTSGPDHKKEFEIALLLNGKEISRAVGSSKKQAQQLAAKIALEKIKK